MNQTISNSGGKSAVHSWCGRVFRRSLTPTLALLAAMALGLVVPPAADAQQDFNVIGRGGGGGGGGQTSSSHPAAGGAGGSLSASPGEAGNANGPGTGGDGGSGNYSAGATVAEGDSTGGTGGTSIRNIGTGTYGHITVLGGTGGDGGAGGDIGSGGAGGMGGTAYLNGAAGTITTMIGDLTVQSGYQGSTGAPGPSTSGGARGAGGVAVMNHQGTLYMNGGPSRTTHSLMFNGATGIVDVYINNIHLNNATANMGTVNLLDNIDRVRFSTISLTNGGVFNVGSDISWYDHKHQLGVFTFDNLYISGYHNQLNLSTDPSSVAYTPGNVGGSLNFGIGNNVTTGTDPMLTVGDLSGGASGLDLSGFNRSNLHIAGSQGYYNYLREGQTITLIKNVNDSAGTFASRYRETVHKGGLRFENFYIQSTGGANADLIATFGGKAQSVRTGEAFTPYFQGHMAALYAVSGGSRPALEQATKVLANTPVSVGEPLISLTVMGSDATLNTGSSVDVESFGGVLAVGARLNNDAGLSTLAVFGEFGSSRYDTYKNIPDLYAFNGGRFKGSGDVDYYGGGVYGHHLFDTTHFAGGFSVDGSLRVGTVKNKYNLDMLDRSGYDISRRYWGGHLGLGYNYLLTNLDTVDMFGQLHIARVENGTFNTSAGERLHLLSAKSTVSRLGARYNHNFNEQLKGYATAAWEYEFEGDVGGSVDRTRIRKAPTVEGSSGFGQLGLNVKSANNPVSLDLSVFGVAGQQEGYGGTLGLKLDF